MTRCYIFRHCRRESLQPKELHFPHRVYCERIFPDGYVFQVIEVKCLLPVRLIPSITGQVLYDRKVFKSLVEIQDFFKQMRQRRYKYLEGRYRNVKMPFLYDF
jgi:hypothetical protein